MIRYDIMRWDGMRLKGCDGRREDVKMIGDDMIRHNEESCRDHAKSSPEGGGRGRRRTLADLRPIPQSYFALLNKQKPTLASYH